MTDSNGRLTIVMFHLLKTILSVLIVIPDSDTKSLPGEQNPGLRRWETLMSGAASEAGLRAENDQLRAERDGEGLKRTEVESEALSVHAELAAQGLAITDYEDFEDSVASDVKLLNDRECKAPLTITDYEDFRASVTSDVERLKRRRLRAAHVALSVARSPLAG
jgi:hypothetical protein